MRISARRRRALLIAAALLAVAARIGDWFLFGRDITSAVDGDGVWYWGVARNLAEQGRLVFDPAASGTTFIRPPGFPALLAVVLRIAGPVPFAAFLTLALISASGLWFLARVAAEIWGEESPAVVLAAFVYALDPLQVGVAAQFRVGSVVTPLTLAFAWLCLRGWRQPSWGRLLAVSLCGALMVHLRVDLIALVLIGPLLVGLSGGRRGSASPTPVWRWLACALLAVGLCLPWSLYASRTSGEPTFVARGATPATGFNRWLLTLPLSLRQWVEGEWEFDDGQLPPEMYPSRVFRSPAEEREARAMMAEVFERGHATPEIQRRFGALAAANIERAPLYTYGWLPLRRSLLQWLHFEKGRKARWPDLFAEPELRHVVYSLVHLPYVVLAFVGFLLSWVALWARAAGPRLLAGLVLGRTYSLALIALVSGRGLFEVRYLSPVHPLAMLLAIAFAVALLDGWRDSRSPAAALRAARRAWLRSGESRPSDRAAVAMP